METSPDISKHPRNWEKGSPEEKSYQDWRNQKVFTGSKDIVDKII